MLFDLNAYHLKYQIKIPQRMSDSPILYHVNIDNIKDQLIEDVKNNFFDNAPSVTGNSGCNTGKARRRNFKLTHITFAPIQRVEELSITEQDLAKEFLLMPFHHKLHDLDTDEIVFDDGKEIFNTLEEAQGFVKTYMQKEMGTLMGKIEKHYHLIKQVAI